MGLFKAERKKVAVAAARHLECGASLGLAGRPGTPWRLRRGVLRLDSPQAGSERFASLAIANDIVGCETLLFGVYTFSISALTDCELVSWPEADGNLLGDSLLATLAAAQQRAAEVLALRGGQAVDRILALVRLLVEGDGQVVLPTRQAIADITDLRFETVSRVIKQLERSGVLNPARVVGVHATRSFHYAG